MFEQLLEELGPYDQLRVNNHWVPVTYLTAFAGSDGQLWMYRREEPWSPRRVCPHNVAKENRLYVMEEGLEQPDFVERFLARHVEAPFTLVRNKLIYGPEVGVLPKPLPHETFALALFIGIQYGRTPSYRQQVEWMASFKAMFDLRIRFQDLPKMQAEYREKTGKQIPLREIRWWRDQFDAGELEIRPGRGLWLATFLKGALVITECITDLPCRLFRAPEGLEIPTSDAPVVLARRANDCGVYHLGGGWLSPDTEASFR